MEACLVSTSHHTVTLQCMKLTNQMILNLNNNMSMAVEFMDIEKPLIQHSTLACYMNYLN
jgi:hypothetical protein